MSEWTRLDYLRSCAAMDADHYAQLKQSGPVTDELLRQCQAEIDAAKAELAELEAAGKAA